MLKANDKEVAGPALADLRRAAVLSQHELADKAAITQVTVSQLETGKVENPRPETIRALAEALGVSPQLVRQAILESRRRALAAAEVEGHGRDVVPTPPHGGSTVAP